MSTTQAEAMTGTSTSGRRLIDHLDSLVTRGDLGALALLRRGLGRAPGDIPEIYAHVLPFLDLPEEASAAWRGRAEDAALLVAALYAQWHQGKARPGAAEHVSLGAAFRQLSRRADSESIEGRFVALLKASREGLPDHLRHAIALLKSKDIGLDWARLYRDIARWDKTDRRARHPVRRAWARDYWERVWEPAERQSGTSAASRVGAEDGSHDDDGE